MGGWGVGGDILLWWWGAISVPPGRLFFPSPSLLFSFFSYPHPRTYRHGVAFRAVLGVRVVVVP